jgi:hypothetical protein
MPVLAEQGAKSFGSSLQNRDTEALGEMGNVGKRSKQAKVSHLSPKGHAGALRQTGRVKSGRRIPGKAVKPSGQPGPRPKARARSEIGPSPVPIVSRNTDGKQTQSSSNIMRQKYVTIGYGRF